MSDEGNIQEVQHQPSQPLVENQSNGGVEQRGLGSANSFNN